MNGKRITALLLAACLTAALPACGKKEAAEESDRTVRIGVFEPLTGADAAAGRRELLGIQYAHYEEPKVTVGRTTYDVELVIVDNESSPETSAEAAEELLRQDVSLVLGSSGDALSLAGSPRFGAAGVAALGVTCTDPGITENNDYYFRVCSTDELQARAMGTYAANRLGAKVAFCIGQWESDRSRRQVDAFVRTFEALGGKTVTEYIPEGYPDLVAYMIQATGAGANIIFAPVDPVYATQLITLTSSLELGLPILGTDVLDDDSILETVVATNRNVQESGLGLLARVYVAAFYTEGGDAAFDAGLRAYAGYDGETGEPVEPAAEEARSGPEDPVTAAAALGYDAYHLALEAIRTAGSVDKADILAVLPSVTCSGVCGKFRFDEAGEPTRDSVYVKSVDTAGEAWRLERKQSAE